MATDHDLKSVTNTLTTTTADRITLDQLWPYVRIVNYDASNALSVLCDGTLTPTAVGEANNVTIIPVSSSKIIPVVPVPGTNTIVISVVGSGNKYSVEGVQTDA